MTSGLQTTGTLRSPSARTIARGATLNRTLARYVVAILTVVIAGFLDPALWKLIQPQITPLLFVAIVVSAWYGGLGPALLATLLGAGVCAFEYHVRLGLSPLDPTSLIRLAIFVVVAGLIAWLSATRGQAQRAMLEAREELEARVSGRTTELTQTNTALRQEIAVRQEAEARLRTSESQLAEAQQLARCGSYSHDFLAGTSTWSAELYRVYGQSPDTFVPTFDAFMKLVHPDDRAFLSESVRRAREAGTQYTHEFRIIHPDGAVKRVRSMGTVQCDADGRVLRMVGATQDITQHEQAADALRESEERFRQMAEANTAVFWMRDPQTTRMIYVSPAYEKIWGRSCASLYDNPRSFIEAILPEDLERASNFFQASTSRGEVEYRIRQPDRTVRWINDRAFPVLDAAGNVYRITGIAEDITVRKHAEEALRVSERRFHEMADTAPVMLWMSAGEPGCTFFNKPWLDFRGRTLEQELGEGWVEGVHPDDRDACLHTYSHARERRQPFRMEYRLRHHDGSYRWVLDTGVPRFEQYGEFIGYIGSAIEITERKTAEDQILAYQRRLRELASELSHAEEHERRRLATILHDDVSQTLAAAVMKLDWMRLSSPEAPISASLKEVAELIEDAIGHTRTLTHELSPPVLYELGFEAAIEQLIERMRQQYRIKLSFTHPPELLALDEDQRILLYRAARELLTNMVKHARATSGHIIVVRDDGSLSVTVEDDGDGFDGDGAELAERGGGFGLFNIRERLKDLGGRLEISSAPGRGSSVRLSVPMREGAKAS